MTQGRRPPHGTRYRRVLDTASMSTEDRLEKERARSRRERGHFDQVVEADEQFYWADRTAAGRRRQDLRSQRLARAAGFMDGWRVLDVGCGTGIYTARLAANGTLDDFRVIVGCTEPSPERVDRLREWGVTDYLKPPWTDGLRATQTSLDYKREEMARFAATYLSSGR